MSIVSDIETQVSNLRAKLGGMASDTESYFSEFLKRAKGEEDAMDSKVTAAIAQLTALGYSVTPPTPKEPT